METRMQRADLTAPTTPEQYRAAIERQERVIADLRAKVKSNEDGCKKAILTCARLGKEVSGLKNRLESAERSLKVMHTWARADALDADHVMRCCMGGLGRGES